MEKNYNNGRFDLTIKGDQISVINPFGERYQGRIDERGNVVSKSRFGLGYIMRAMSEFGLR